jgi:hypothetical protein
MLGLDAEALGGIAATLGDGGLLVVLASVVPSDGVDGLDCLDGTRERLIRDVWSGAGIDLVSMRPATAADVGAARSTWGRRLGAERPVWRLEGRRSASIGR